MHTLTHF